MAQPDPRGTERRFDSGDRVTLAGTVSYERSGFVLVRWDGGSTSLVWGADLEPHTPEGE